MNLNVLVHGLKFLEVTGYYEGKDKFTGMLGGIIVDFNGVEVRVGGGYTEQQRKDLWEIRDQLLGRIAEVKYMELTNSNPPSLRHPIFLRFRDYKSEKC